MSFRTDVRNLYLFDKDISDSIVGLDEAGRGPLAGPVVAAAVVLDMANPIQGINDSKKLSAEVREKLYGCITEKAVNWAVGIASVEEIDRINILQASLLAMRRALESIKFPWKLALIDGNQKIPGIDPGLQQTVVGGDARSASIGAASIIAKVTRDKMMAEYNEKYPLYEFNINKGYGTESHRAIILQHGLCEIHRRTFCENLTAYQTELPL
jgi:ribonuclease HII